MDFQGNYAHGFGPNFDSGDSYSELFEGTAGQQFSEPIGIVDNIPQGYGQGFEYAGIMGPADYTGYPMIDPYASQYSTGQGRQSYLPPIEIDPQSLVNLGFNQAYIDVLYEAMNCMGNVTQAKLIRAGLCQNDAYIIKYMYDICVGKVRVETPDELAKHLRKLFGRFRRIGIQDLAVSRISDIPRVAVVAGIPNGPFAIYNSNRYSVKDRIYKVVSVSSTNITIESSRLPVLRYKEPRFIEDIIEIKEKTKRNTVILEVNRKHCRLCNRFIVVASMKRPEFHHGMIEIICIEGTRVYIYVATASKSERLSYNSQTQRIYNFGYFPFEIETKLKESATSVYQKLCGVYSEFHPANSDYKILMEDKSDNSDSNSEEVLGIVD